MNPNQHWTSVRAACRLAEAGEPTVVVRYEDATYALLAHGHMLARLIEDGATPLFGVWPR